MREKWVWLIWRFKCFCRNIVLAIGLVLIGGDRFCIDLLVSLTAINTYQHFQELNKSINESELLIP